jgi:hypothetical protein
MVEFNISRPAHFDRAAIEVADIGALKAALDLPGATPFFADWVLLHKVPKSIHGGAEKGRQIVETNGRKTGQ